MSGKKNLLNEAQVRKFMKLAKLEPLTQGFVNGLSETTETEEELEELRTGRTGALYPGSSRNPGHGRGQGEAPDGSLFQEAPEDPEALEDYAAGDEERDHPEEAEADELEADVEMEPEMEPEGGEGRMVSVDDFLAALETALEDAIGDEVEIDSDEMEDEEAEMDMEMGQMGPGDEEEIEMGAEEEMMEGWEAPKSAGGASNTHKGSKQHPDHRNKKNSAGGLASKGPGLVKEEDDDDEDLEEGTHKGDEDEGGDKAYGSPRKGGKLTRSGKGRGEKKGDEAYVNENTDDLVERITKRVAARILKSALRR
jgi:hypothetical protein